MFQLPNQTSAELEKLIKSSLLINIILTRTCQRLPPDALGGFPSARWLLAARCAATAVTRLLRFFKSKQTCSSHSCAKRNARASLHRAREMSRETSAQYPCHSRIALGLLAQGSGAVWPHILSWLLSRPVLTPFLHRHIACSSPMAFPSCVSWLDGAPNRACTCVPSPSAYRLFGSRPISDAYQWAILKHLRYKSLFKDRNKLT
jgi:hypothetical protein